MNIARQTSYAEPGYEAYITNLEKDLAGFAELQGKQNGLINLPVTEPEFRAYILNPIETRIQATIYRNQQLYLPIAGVVVAQKAQAEAGKEIGALKAELAEDEHKLRPLLEQKKDVTPDLAKRRLRRWVYIGAAIIAAAEGFFAYEAFRAASFPKVSAFFAAIGIAIGVGFGLHFAARYILKAPTPAQRLFRYAMILIPAFIGFFVLGNLRAESYNTHVSVEPQTTEVYAPPSAGVSGMGLTIVSFILFWIALSFSVRFYKQREERHRDQEYDRICKEIKMRSGKMEAAKRKIETIQVEANRKATDALGRFEYAHSVEKRLIAIARQSLQTYIDANLRHRQDKCCPTFFSTPPSFNFKLFFDNAKPA
jgi:hypothetical protein